MADSNKNEIPEETEDTGNTQTVPASSESSMDMEPLMVDLTDDEVIITDANKRQKLDDDAKFEKDPEILPLDGGTQNKSPPPPARVTSPVRPRLPPVSPRGAAPAFQFPQDIRLGAGGAVRPKGYDQRPSGKGFYGMPPAALTREQQELMDIQTVIHAQGSQIEVLRGTMEGIGDNVSGVQSNVSIMNGAFKKIMADNVNAMRAVSDRVSRVETGMEGVRPNESSPEHVGKPYTKSVSVRKCFHGK